MGVIKGLLFSGDSITNLYGQNDCVLNIYYDPLQNPGLEGSYAFADGLGHLMPTPLPASLLLLGSGLLGLELLSRRQKKQG